MSDNKCCGTCAYSTYCKINGYLCCNPESEYVADFVEYEFGCEEWKGKGE